MPVGRLPVETAALEVGDLRGEAEDERRPLAVQRGVARARAREEAHRRVALEDEGGHEQIERARECEAHRHQPVHQRLGRIEGEMVRAVGLRRPPEDEHAVPRPETQHGAKLARRAHDPAQRAVQIEIVDARGAGRERAADREAIERAAEVRPRRAREHSARREQRRHAGSGGWADRHRDPTVERGEPRQPLRDGAGQRAGRIVERGRERDLGGHPAHGTPLPRPRRAGV